MPTPLEEEGKIATCKKSGDLGRKECQSLIKQQFDID